MSRCVSLSASSGPPRSIRAACRAALPCALLAVRAACRAAGAVSLRSTPPFTPFAFAHVRSGSPPLLRCRGWHGLLVATIRHSLHHSQPCSSRARAAPATPACPLRTMPIASQAPPSRGGMSPCAAPPRSIPPPPSLLALSLDLTGKVSVVSVKKGRLLSPRPPTVAGHSRQPPHQHMD